MEVADIYIKLIYHRYKFIKNTEITVPNILSVPGSTMYDIDSGSYFVSYNSFKQTRKPVWLMY